MDKKKIGIIVSAIGGIILAFITYYIFSTFDDDTADIASSTAVIAGFIAFIGLIVIFINHVISERRRKAGKSEKVAQTKRNVIYLITLCLAMALSAFVVFFKAMHDEEVQERQLQQHVYASVSGRKYLINRGWDEICVCTPRTESGYASEEPYYIFCKDDHYIAITEEDAQGHSVPEQYSVTCDDYYLDYGTYNARISKNGRLLYFNF